ncbi:MAG: tetratricopeptide repeat protein, partial [Planctomycetota bacterium]
GKADALAQQGKRVESVEAYESVLRIPSARARAFEGKAQGLVALERWRDLEDFLEKGLEEGNLPSAVTRKMESLLAKARPMSAREPVLTLGAGGAIPEGAMVADPLAIKVENGSLSMGGDGQRHTWMLLPYRFSGEPFRLEVRGHIDRLDWASFLFFGLPALEGPTEEGCLAGLTVHSHRKRAFMTSFEPGDDTSHPALFAYTASSGWTYAKHHEDTRRELLPYPVSFPLAFDLVIDYGPTLDFVKVVIRGPDGKVLHEARKEVELQLPQGAALVGIMLGPGNVPSWGWGTRFCGVTLDRFQLFAPSRGTFIPLRKPPHGEEILALANGHLVAGRVGKAIGMYTGLIDAPPGEEDCPAEMKDWPDLRIRARLFRGLARFRSGEAAEARSDAESAVKDDPFHVLFLLQQDFPHLGGSFRKPC